MTLVPLKAELQQLQLEYDYAKFAYENQRWYYAIVVQQLISYISYLFSENEKLQIQLNSFLKDEAEKLELSDELQRADVVNMVTSECERTVVEPSGTQHKLCVQRTSPDAVLPRKMTKGSAGYDISSIENIIIPTYPENRKIIHTGIKVQFPSNMYGKIAARSSLAKMGINVLGGIIDNDYQGEILVIMINYSPLEYVIKKGDN